MTDGLLSYGSAAAENYVHEPFNVKASGQPAHIPLPGVHRVASLFKRWLLGTTQGAVDADHLPSYLNEFVFRFNRRNARHRGLLFQRLLAQAVQGQPRTFKSLVANPAPRAGHSTPATMKRIRPETLDLPVPDTYLARPWNAQSTLRPTSNGALRWIALINFADALALDRPHGQPAARPPARPGARHGGAPQRAVGRSGRPQGTRLRPARRLQHGAGPRPAAAATDRGSRRLNPAQLRTVLTTARSQVGIAVRVGIDRARQLRLLWTGRLRRRGIRLPRVSEQMWLAGPHVQPQDVLPRTCCSGSTTRRTSTTWRCTSGGVVAPITRSVPFQQVAVPAGTSKVTFRFAPHGARASEAAFLLGLLALLLGVARGGRRPRAQLD